MNRDRIAALIMLAISIAYGVVAHGIELYPGSEMEPFTARTMPYILAWTGGAIAILLLLVPAPRTAPASLIEGRQWGRVALLCLAMVGYGLTIKSVGFLLSTTAFLALGFAILGERRWRLLVFVPLPVAACFQFILHGLLGVYIEDPVLAALGIIQ